jgi:hypothetical protein
MLLPIHKDFVFVAEVVGVLEVVSAKDPDSAKEVDSFHDLALAARGEIWAAIENTDRPLGAWVSGDFPLTRELARAISADGGVMLRQANLRRLIGMAVDRL